MSKLRMPYQCLQKCGNILIAARGSSIDSFSLEDRSLLSSWKCPTPFQDLKIAEPSKSTTEKSDTEPSPAKKRKLSVGGDSEKPEVKKKSNNRADAVSSGLEAPAVIALAVRGQHVVAVTGEDKSIRVFENMFKEDGKHYLKHISQRAMPKRPCALAVTKESTIISADKFGDVYSIPLFYKVNTEQYSNAPSSSTGTPEPATPFVPSANNLTVHSQRNLKALENQKKQTNKPTEKAVPKFEHKLLLGHVSMLTDIALTELDGRNYILTADRDEHIRISRGIPQSHIIEGFCLGHTEFVARLCIPAERPTLLVSGGGDTDIFLWEWASGTLLFRAALEPHVRGVNNSKSAVNVAVSGILHIRLPNKDTFDDIMIVTCEGVPALFTFLLTSKNALQHIQVLQLSGNVLSTITDNSDLIVSIDNIHKPGSTTELRDISTDVEITPIKSYSFVERQLVEKESFALVEGEEQSTNALSGLLYNLENLRKREDAPVAVAEQ